MAHQRAGNLLHATQIVSKVQKRCMHTKIFHSQCNAISQPTKKSCFCVVIRLKTSQNKKNMQPFTSYQDKSVVLDTPAKIPRLNHPIFPHTAEILYLFGILRINTGVSGMLACRYPPCLSAGSAQEYQKDIKSPLETRPPFIVK